MASASDDETVRLWNATTGEHLSTLDGHTDGVKVVTYSPDGSLIATGGFDHSIRLWDAGTMTCISILIGYSDWVCDVVFSPRGDQIASAGEGGTVKLWSVATGSSLVLTGHDKTVHRVAYSLKGDLLASGSWDKTVRLWDVAFGQCQAVVQNFQGNIYGVAWIPSADTTNYLVTGCQDGSVHKWQVTEEEGQHLVYPCWFATNGSLVVAGASIQGVRGLTPSNNRLLKQRGAVCESDRSTNQPPETAESSDGKELDSIWITDLLDEQQPQADQQVVPRMDRRMYKSKGRRHHPYRRTT